MNVSNKRSRSRSRSAVLAMKIGVSALILASIASPAFAAGWIDAANRIKELGDAVIVTITVLCGAGGVGAIGYAGKLLMKKSGDRGDDVEWSKIGYAVLAGAFLLSVAFVAVTTVETLGGSSSNVNSKLRGTP